MTAVDVNFDGLVGPTHNYAGLSRGNLASRTNEGRTANPRAAALQGLAKMRALMALGLRQGVLPPQARPDIDFLRQLGFSGDDASIWRAARRDAPALARAAIAATSMWTANAATVTASADARDGRVHISVANLTTMLHRQLEADTTARALRRIFADPTHFCVHDPLTPHPWLADEGAANHMRLASAPDAPGVNIFVYGRSAEDHWRDEFPARQTLEASQAIARRHGLDPRATRFVRQNARAIAAGAFHNDVVAVSGADVLFQHEHAFEATGPLVESAIVVPEAQVSLHDAVQSYLFNSQLVAVPGRNGLVLIAPTEAQENSAAGAYLKRLIAAGGPIGEVMFFDLRESMRNGGGPACLRLRAPLTAAEATALTPGFLLTPALADALEAWVRRWYRDRLSPDDLDDPRLIEEGRAALDALTAILPLGADFYPFQRIAG